MSLLRSTAVCAGVTLTTTVVVTLGCRLLALHPPMFLAVALVRATEVSFVALAGAALGWAAAKLPVALRGP